MKHIFRFGMLATLALGFVFVTADEASAQNRRNRAVREYRDDIRDARKDYREDIRDGDSRREAIRDYREEVREANREYARSVTRGRSGWYFYRNNRRYYRPYAQYGYRNGYFYRRW